MRRILVAGTLLALAACGDDRAADSSTISAPGTTVAMSTGDLVVIEVVESGGFTVLVDGEESEVGSRIAAELGDTVRIIVTLATADEVHVHVYDVSVDAAAGVATTLEFVADIPGIFEVELESGHTLLLELEVS